MNKEAAAERFAMRCGPCVGSGVLANHKSCLVCRGEGMLMLQGSIENYRDCPNCGGSGFKGFDTRSLCTMCDGVGAIQVL